MNTETMREEEWEIEFDEKWENITIIDKSTEKTSEILAKARSLFSVSCYDEEGLDIQFLAPEEDLTVLFLDSIESDPKHKGKSYNDFIVEKDRSYMTMRQYLLMFIKVYQESGKCLDRKGWTRTASLWSDGSLVYGHWCSDFSGLWLHGGYRDGRDADDGPREQFLNL